MRTYAYLYDRETNKFSIIFRDDTDPYNCWYVMERDLSESNAKLIVEALNKTTS